MKSRVLAFVLMLMCASCWAAPKLDRRTLSFQHNAYRYLLYTPDSNSGGPMPALLLLHGAGGHAEEMVSAWQQTAERNGILLISLEWPRELSFEDVVPQVARAAVEDAKQAASIDSRRVYVFGHSAGGYLTFDIAMFDSTYFAAAAVHASFIAPDYVSIVNNAQRKTPIALYIGEKDPFVSLNNVRATRALLERNNFPLHYMEVPGHDHNYAARAEQINADAWKFLSAQKLPKS